MKCSSTNQMGAGSKFSRKNRGHSHTRAKHLTLETNIIVKEFEFSDSMYNLKYQNMIGNDKIALATESGEGACN